MFLQIIRLTTKIRGSFSEDMLNLSPYVILYDDLLEVCLGEGCSITKDGDENIPVKCSGHDYVSFTLFVME